MKSLINYIGKVTIAAIFLLSFSFVYAQVPNSIDGIEISAEPETPNPGQTVTISVESFTTDLNSASIVWLVDGKNYSQGTGLKSIGINAPMIGKSTNIVAAVMTVEGREVKKSITLRSGSVDIVWESAGYVPPFYKGKTPLAYENPIKVTAVPHLAGSNGVEIDPKTLVYKWKKNDKVVQDQSGYGKQTLSVQEDIPRPLDIEVEVTTKNGDQKGIASMTLEPGNPSITFYEESPLYGTLYNKSLENNVNLLNQEITIKAVPYTFNFNTKNSPLTYLWSINNLERQDLSTNQSITLRTKGDTEGTSDVSLEIRNANDILQGAKNSIKVSFTKKPEENNVTF